MNLKFWKKDDLALPDLNKSFNASELGLKDNTALDLTSHFEPSASFPALNQQPPPAPPQFSMQQSYTPQAPSFSPAQPQYTEEPANATVAKELEIIAAKLDTIRAQLEMLNARVAHMEQASNQAQPKRPWY